MLLIDILKEYLLIAKHRSLRKKYATPPERWCKGKKGCILLLPGWHETFHAFLHLSDILNKEGFEIHTIENFDSRNKVADLAKLAAKEINSIPSDSIILLSHSKGGIVAKYLLDNFPEIREKVICLISIAVPYGGTITGNLKFHNVHELLPNSSIIKNLQSEVEPSIIYNFYPMWDNHVIPNKSMVFPGTYNKEIKVKGHTRILESDELAQEIISVLDQL